MDVRHRGAACCRAHMRTKVRKCSVVRVSECVIDRSTSAGGDRNGRLAMAFKPGSNPARCPPADVMRTVNSR